jgi:hypothetical protein
LLAFGDWSVSEYGEASKKLIKKYLNQIDGIMYLGDLAYDLQDENGQIGNLFLEFITDISSKVPFQVIL